MKNAMKNAIKNTTTARIKWGSQGSATPERGLGRSPGSLVIVLSLLFCAFTAEANSSQAWQARLLARTVTLWIDGERLGEDLILNARGELNVTWLERALAREQDRHVEEWVIMNLSYYFSQRKDTRAKLKGRDILVLNYRAAKYWDFDPTKLVVDGYAIVRDDILTKSEYWHDGTLAPGARGNLAVCVPALKPGRSVKIRYEDAEATFEAPRR
ncbi:MAG: hypothetical protein LBQ90_05270 [Synergistaceae bacterium]|nr:hypothetical protein [Synergistaceae bacterium]